MARTSSTLRARRAVLLLIGLLTVASWAGPAWSVTLEQAKAQGLVGEQPNGYFGLVAANASAEVQALVADINKKRRAEYQAIAQRNNTTVEAVEALAGKKAIERTPPGQHGAAAFRTVGQEIGRVGASGRGHMAARA